MAMASEGDNSIQETIKYEAKLKAFLKNNYWKLICLEIYSVLCGPCNPLAEAMKHVKFGVGRDKTAIAKKGQICRSIFGGNGIFHMKVAEEELDIMVKENKTVYFLTPKYKLNALIPEIPRELISTHNIDFERKTLEVHNNYRKQHGVKALVLNEEICKISQNWAEELAIKDTLDYSLNNEYGENIYCGKPNSVKDCVDIWYNEIHNFTFGKEPFILESSNFTQIVWKDTRELGIGSAKSKSGKLYTVANYYPPGNHSGQFATQVLPPGIQILVLSKPNPGAPNKKPSISNIPGPSNQTNNNNLASKSQPAGTSNKKTSFEEEFLKAHNEYRRIHTAPPLALNQKISQYSEEWAKVLVKKGKMEHRNQNTYGENIYFAWSSDPNYVVTGKDPVDRWYEEIKDHTFGKEPTTLASGHFTQVVWEDTKEVGVGVAKSKEGHVYVVANYLPPGNVIGSFTTKVHPPKK